MRILKFEAENIKRLRVVRITPKGNAIVIAGNNAQGKSSVLDSIEMVLGGKNASPAEPLRRGEKKGHAKLDLGDIVAKRTFTADGSSQLVVTGKDGAKVARPQEVLDALVGSLSFDPLHFTRMEPRDQVATLRELAGLDFSLLDTERAKLFADRTENTRELKRVSALFEKAEYHEDAPAKEVSVADLLKELEARRAQNATVKADREKLEAMRKESAQLQDTIERLEAELAAAKAKREQLIADGKTFAALVAAMVEANEPEILERMSTADALNKKVRDNADYSGLETMMERLAKIDAEMTGRISQIDEDKKAQLAAAKFHVEGLTFSEDGVKLNGLPFSQASSAEQLRVSVAIGLAMNPELKVLLIRDGALLDEQSLAALEKQAEAADAQVWIEVVGTQGHPTVVIEDGEVRDAAKAGAA